MITIPHNRIAPNGEEAVFLAEAANSGEWAEGRAVSRVEGLFASFFGVPHAVCVDSGLSALRLALNSLELPRKSQVFVPAYSCVALANAPLSLGYECIPIDVDGTWNMNHKSVPQMGAGSPERVIIAVNTFGLPADEVLSSHGGVIEDASHGFRVDPETGKAVLGADVAILSTYSTKLIGGGKGGVILVKEGDIADKLRRNRSYADLNPASWRLNCSMSNLDAALLAARFEQLSASIIKRGQLAQNYTAAFSPLVERGLARLQHDSCERVWYRYCLQVMKKTADHVILALEKLGVGVERPVEIWHKALGFSCPKAERLYDSLVSIPLYPSLTDEEQQRVIDGVFKVLQQPE